MNQKGLTLIELLVVITIIAILASASVIALNPGQILAKARDAKRMSDIVTINKAITLAIAQGGNFSGISGNSVDGTRAVDGTGYVPLNIENGLITLPLAPQNGQTITNSNGVEVIDAFYFQAQLGGIRYELKTSFESQIYKDHLINDGGNENEYFEIGSYLSLELP